MNLIVIGGGCFGTAQAGRLLTAIDRGLVPGGHIIVVDRNERPPARAALGEQQHISYVQSDWLAFLRDYFGRSPSSEDQLVPAHIAPHLLLEVAASVIGGRTGRPVLHEPVTASFGLPFESRGEGGIKYISAAAWLCPFSCIEPEICPAIRDKRDWDLSTLVPAVMSKSADMSLVFKTTHFAWGVGTIPCRSVRDAFMSVISRAASSPDKHLHVSVATTSNCHGVVGMLGIG